MKKVIKIGKVPLILDYYGGSDDYSDGDNVENFMLDVTKKFGDIDYTQIIVDNISKYSFPILFMLSDLRQTIIDWYPFSEGETCLEIGAGCGAVTNGLVKRCKKVTAVDLSKRRCTINAQRNSNAANLKIYASNFMDYVKHCNEKYTLITLIGVLEYSMLYVNSENPFVDLIKKSGELLDKNGTILIAIENRLGLKYFAGSGEDHLGTFFSGIEGYNNTDKVRTFSRKELSELCSQAGFSDQRFYYPYPDYKFPVEIFSDDYLPQAGNLNCNFLNFTQDRYILFDENKAFGSVISAGLFPEFSNSFLVELKR